MIKVKELGPKHYSVYENMDKWLQSYNCIIAHIDSDGRVVLDEIFWNHSKITDKYRNIFLGECKKETEKKIKNGAYRLSNLNC